MTSEQQQIELETGTIVLGIAYAASLISLIVWVA